jgi:outer membrane protein OmpA-like peptidoglycan-associated protein
MSLEKGDSTGAFMTKIFIASASALILAGCASTMPMDGGRLDDHATVTSKCGVGNYTFYHLREACQPVADISEADEYAEEEYVDEDSIGMSESSAFFEDDHIDLTQEVTFKTGSAELDQNGRETLDDVAWVIKSNDDRIARVNVEGHTDATGSPELNQALSQARAQSVRTYLINRGVDSSKLTAVGYGESMPKFNESTATSDELSRNRRVDFAVEGYEYEEYSAEE